MTFVKLSVAATAAAFLLVQAASAGNQGQGNGQGRPECPGAPGAVTTVAGTTPAATRGAAPATIAPAFDNCDIGAFPQADATSQDAKGQGKAKNRN